MITRRFEEIVSMFCRLGILVALMLQLILPSQAWAAFDQKHSLWTAELKKYSEGPLIHYKKWKADQAGLTAYLKTLSTITPAEYEKFTVEQKKALWINAYNALAVKIVLDHYPIQSSKPYYPANSMRQIPNVWDDFKTDVAGKKVCLYDIAHNVIRHDFNDPRMHFAIVCASKGCPSMKQGAYVAETVEKDLDAASRTYVNNPHNVQFDGQKHLLKVSQLFKWFPLDFAAKAGYTKIPFPPPTDDEIVVAYLATVVSPEMKKLITAKDVKVTYLAYDWSLNDADEAPATKTSLEYGGTYGDYPSFAAAICGCHPTEAPVQ